MTMKFVLELDKENIINQVDKYLKKIVFFLYSWLSTDGEILGYILGIWHILISITIFMCIIISHTIYPNFWFQCAIFIATFLIWFQHIFLHVCVVFITEMKLTNSEPPFYTIFKNITNLDLSKYQIHFILIETTGVMCFGLEIISRCFHYLFKYINN